MFSVYMTSLAVVIWSSHLTKIESIMGHEKLKSQTIIAYCFAFALYEDLFIGISKTCLTWVKILM